MRTPESRAAATDAPLHPLLAERWSTRAFDRDATLADEDLLALLEAARWAPSASNTQPWRFLVARRGEEQHDRLLVRLAEGNRVWADAASVLVLVAAEVRDEAGAARPWAHYDTGAAVAALVTQAQALGLAVHQMGGFDAPATARDLGLPARVQPLVVLAVGRYDASASLPPHLAEREVAARTRLPLESLLLDGAAPSLRLTA